MGMALSDMAAVVAIIGFLCSFGGFIVYAILRTKFITIEECEKTQASCSTTTCRKIDGLEAEIKELRNDLTAYREMSEAKRDEAKEKLTEQLTQIRLFMERIKPYLPAPQNHTSWEHLNGATGRGFGGSAPKDMS